MLRHAFSVRSRRPALYELARMINDLVRSAVDTVSGADAGGVSVASEGESASHGSTSEAAADLDAVQHALHEGPCLTALAGPRTAGIVVAGDLSGSDARRWPRFAAPAVELGYLAALSLPLPALPGTGAALNLYGRAADSFEPGDVVLADMFVAHLAVLMFGEAALGDRVPLPEMGPEVEERLQHLRRPPAQP